MIRLVYLVQDRWVVISEHTTKGLDAVRDFIKTQSLLTHLMTHAFKQLVDDDAYVRVINTHTQTITRTSGHFLLTYIYPNEYIRTLCLRGITKALL